MIDLKLQEQLARFGAEARLRALEEQRQAILGMFPELRTGTASGGRVRNAVAERSSASPTPKRKRMSLAMRKAVGDRMRAYWATRRAEQQRAHSQANGGPAQVAKQSTRRRNARRAARDGSSKRLRRRGRAE
jgi:hypothetical protein